MDEEKLTEIIARQPAEESFSVVPLQREIDKQLGTPDRREFTLDDLKRLSKIANRALREADEDNPYTADVLVVMNDGNYVYDMQVDPPRRVERSGKVLYGYVNGFMVTVPEGAQRELFAAAFEEYSSDVTEGTHSYLLPLAVKGTNYGVRLIDAPTPVAENRVEVPTQSMHDIAREDIEQDRIHSLLNIIESDLFEEDTVAVDILEDSIEGLENAGFIEDIDDMTTACNYYFQMCLHNDDPWKVNSDNVMERLDGTTGFDERGKRKGMLQWVSDELTVVGIDLSRDGDGNVRCAVYAYSEEGALYRCLPQKIEDEHLLLYREDDTEDDEVQGEDQ